VPGVWLNYSRQDTTLLDDGSDHAVIRKPVREGHVVSEAPWKKRQVVAGNAGRIPLQIVDGEAGFPMNSQEECAGKPLHLPRNPQEAEEVGARMAEFVRDNSLTTRYLRDYRSIFCRLAGVLPAGSQPRTQRVARKIRDCR
jgi:trehalose synthase